MPYLSKKHLKLYQKFDKLLNDDAWLKDGSRELGTLLIEEILPQISNGLKKTVLKI